MDIQKYVMIDYQWCLWTGDFEPPCVGDVVNVSVNGIGPATVRGWKSIEGYAGPLTEPHSPPDWYIRNCWDEVRLTGNPFSLIGVSFGTEVSRAA